jgi:hypothetical protein
MLPLPERRGNTSILPKKKKLQQKSIIKNNAISKKVMKQDESYKDHDDAVMYSIEREGGRKEGGITYEYSVKGMRPIPAMILLCPYLPLIAPYLPLYLSL